MKNINRRNFIKTTLSSAAVIGAPMIVPAKVFGKNAPSNTINVGQIGCGRIARGHDMPGTLANDCVNIIAVSDLDSKRVKEGKQWVNEWYKKNRSSIPVDVKTFGDYREMLKLPELDAVIISTPDHWHAQPAIEAALAGKDIYLQKPASLTIEEGRLMSDVIHRTGRILQIGSQQRSMPQFRIAAELVRNGYIGNIKNVVIGLPYDPSGDEEPEMPIPANLNYDMWLGETPWRYYTEKGVHPQDGYSRPGWLRCEQFGAGMITGWGAHHLDSMNWGLGTEYTGPVMVEADAEFPKSGLWDVHGAFLVNGQFESGTTFQVSDKFPNGVKFEGDEGWIFVTRGNYAATDSDPVKQKDNAKALDASDPKILQTKLKDTDVHLTVSDEQHKNWIESIKSRKQPIAPAEVGHRACTGCLISHIAMKLDRKLHWDPVKERFHNDDEANSMLSRPQRYPWGTDYVDM